MSEQGTTKDLFSVGEIAILSIPGDPYDGTEVTIVGPLAWRDWFFWRSGENIEGMAYLIDGGGLPYGEMCCRPQFLRKKKPPREDLRVVRWDECPWQPQQVTA
jgi:hypothetical protein